MAGNTFGQIFRLTTFGESHGSAIGLVIDGCPAGLEIDLEEVNADLRRRRPGQSAIVSQRKEADSVEILSGVLDGRTLGTPIAMLIRNRDARPADYDHLADAFRPSHADFTWQEKYGVRDHRGGGRSSARETACRVAAGAIARQLLRREGIGINAFVSQVGDIFLDRRPEDVDTSLIESNPVRCPDTETARRMEDRIRSIRKQGDTIGGVVTCLVQNCPAGLGEPVFGKLQADLAAAVMSINATRGFEIGSGFGAVRMRGSEHNDLFTREGNRIVTRTNHSGGIQGGISNGMPIWFRVAFKPVATIVSEQESVNSAGDRVTVRGKGRHDPCVVPRAVPIVEAMTALVLADHLLRQRLARI